jgi:cellulose synthase/poly-beta-1,6-N-acetylglucosamine synthase-like glycosyltransferase
LAAINELRVERQDFDARFIKSCEVIDPLTSIVQRSPGVLYIPLQMIVSLPGVSLDEIQTDNDLIRTLKNEMLKLLIYHEGGAAQGLAEESLEKRDLEYLSDQDPAGLPSIPHYSDAPPADYHIIAPVYNEGKDLPWILEKIKSLGYLHKITFVNDASTDNSREILEQWQATEGIDVLHLIENRKIEGAIRDVLEKMDRENRLPDKIILLDADSFLETREKDKKLEDVIAQASAYMDQEDVAGMAFRIDPLLPEKPNLLQKMQYVEYSSSRFWNRISAKQHQLWVINGPGGIFKGKVLLDTLRGMVPDFETGDLLITVKMMKQGYRVGYFRDIKSMTTVPKTPRELFKQRQRWERGTTKVVFGERGFYAKLFPGRKIVALQTLLWLAIYPGLVVGVAHALSSIPSLNSGTIGAFFSNYFINYIIWVIIGSTLGISDSGTRREGDALKVFKWSFLVGIGYLGIVMPGRVSGFCQAIKFFLSGNKLNTPPKTPNSLSSAAAFNNEFLKAAPDKELSKGIEVFTNSGTSSSAISDTKGGIDFNAKNMNVETKGQGVDLNVPENWQNLRPEDIIGFTPVIINVVPVTDFIKLLGLNNTDNELQAKSNANSRLSEVKELQKVETAS